MARLVDGRSVDERLMPVPLGSVKDVIDEIAEVTADELGLLERPVLTISSREFERSKAVAAALAKRILRLSWLAVSEELDYGDHSSVAKAAGRVDKALVERVLARLKREGRVDCDLGASK